MQASNANAATVRKTLSGEKTLVVGGKVTLAVGEPIPL
jgi:hypothetical protein